MSKTREKTILVILVGILLISFLQVVPVSAVTTWTVGSGKTYSTIQAAINGASTGDIIEVYTGTYVQDLVVNASVELVAVGDVTIEGVATAVWPNMPPNIEVIANDVEIHGFTIMSPLVSGTPVDTASGGLVLDGSNIEIYDNDFVSRGATTTTFGQCFVIQTLHQEWGGNVGGLYIHNNTFLGNPDGGYVGIYLNPGDTSGITTVTDNTFSGPVIQGIMTEHDSTLIEGNTLTTTISTGYRVGIGVYDGGWGSVTPSDGSLSNVEVFNNDVSGFQQGLRFGVSTKTLTNIETYNNLVHDNDRGVQVSEDASNIQFMGNYLYDNDLDVQNQDGTTFDAALNYWGTGSPNVEGYVDTSPWLILSAGPTGAQGPTGATGAKGATGSTGPRGAKGPQGLEGETGATGETGPQGNEGIQGVPGETGLSGLTGPLGEQGELGADGNDGEQGPKGDTGETGSAGATGAEGPQGESGSVELSYVGIALGAISLLGLAALFLRES